ncbi:MAG: SpoIIE family protein phosphatase [Desulfatibacillum sp.]|nr:SpoIIE family protein phosphatase [Desulfatibacillum sp.]
MENKSQNSDKPELLKTDSVIRTVRRRTIGGNLVGMLMCMSYFVYFDSLYIARNMDMVVYGTLIFFVLQVGVSGYLVRRWMGDILAYLGVQHGLMQIKPGMKEIAQRKVINLPYLCAIVSFGNWLAASVVIPTLVLIAQPAGKDWFIVFRMFAGILFSGCFTGALLYFNMEIFGRRIWPMIFPDDSVTGIRGALRMKMRARMIISLFLTGVFPTIMLSVVVYNKTRLMLAYNPDMILQSLLAVISFILAGSFIATIIVSRMAAKSIVEPLQHLERAIIRVERGDFQVRVPLISNDELGTLTENFNKMVGVLRDRERMRVMEVEMEQGRRIQQDFLPKTIPEVPGWEIDAAFFPARQVSGDFYDAFKLPDGSVAFVIADVCDKGVGSALFMALFRSLLRVYALQLGDVCDDLHNHENPLQSALYAVSHTNDYIASVHGENGMFATVFLGVFDPETGDLHYVNAGHEPPILVSGKGIRQNLHPTGPAAGLRPGIVFNHESLNMAPGDMLFGYTDGVLDARNPAGESFSRERVKFLIEESPDSARGLIRTMETRLFSHMAGESQFDDITMIAIRRKP